MAFNRFTINVLMRLVVLLATMFVFVWYATIHMGLFTLGWMLALVGFQVWWLFRYLLKTNDELAAFLMGLHHQDTMRNYDPDKAERQFSNLRYSFRKINHALQTVRFEKEKQHQLYQSLIDQSPIGLMTLNKQGEIAFCNRAAMDILALEGGFSPMGETRKLSEPLVDFIDNLYPGSSEIFPFCSQSEKIPVSFSRKNLLVAGENLWLITLVPVREALEQQEIASWQKLIRVLTHEMMNTITPVVTLSKNMEMCLKPIAEIPGLESEKEYVVDALRSAEMIGERSQGLMNFVSDYRNLTLLPEPSPSQVVLSDFLGKHAGLFLVSGREQGISITVNATPEDLSWVFDADQVGQALVNLLKNALEAFSGKKGGMVEVKSYKQDDRLVVQVSDNGPGIDQAILDAVFVPFFTTRKEGSGVGLSLCRQIMMMHKGRVELKTKKGKGTSVCLIFPPSR